MTTTTRIPTAAGAVRLSFRGVLRSESGKLASLRSVSSAAVAVVLLVVAGMALRAFAYAEIADPTDIGVSSDQAWRNVLDVGVQAGQLAAIVLAVLAIGSEYTGRAGLSTFVAVPRRLLVLTAKAVAVVVAVALSTVAGLVLGTLACTPLMLAAKLDGPSGDTAGGVLAAIVLMVVYALFAFAVGALTRSTAAGITIVLAVLLALPLAGTLLGAVLGIDLVSFLLSSAAPAATSAIHDPAAMADLAVNLPVTLLWVLVPGAAAAFALTRRDV